MDTYSVRIAPLNPVRDQGYGSDYFVRPSARSIDANLEPGHQLFTLRKCFERFGRGPETIFNLVCELLALPAAAFRSSFLPRRPLLSPVQSADLKRRLLGTVIPATLAAILESPSSQSEIYRTRSCL